jgi:hypothetical protein
MHLKADKAGITLILLSSVLLGIWATMHTIALRNVFLGFSGLLATFYWVEYLKTANKSPFSLRPPLIAWAPLGLIALMFFWVVVHFTFFSVEPQQQLNELRSTWVRAVLAALVGSATGLSLNQNRAYAPWLWLGLTASFLILIAQYIPKALKRHSIFGIDFFGDYIYWAKFNGVLAGTILIAGLLGLLIDYFRVGLAPSKSRSASVLGRLKTSFLVPAYALFGIFLAAYSFVFIFDAKAGVGLSIILIGFWVLVGAAFLVFN